ncbi:histidine kinase [Chryseobacterium sp. Leaf180]|uniref:ATP-binding protein n=1 Tax=Chryseobacterium sp. Leaf180 TaxID=1736289 RepID=UPI0006F81816|nr:ATP-binding protein [Chryseobacterium sp. Leaf180]KQR92492.1 histidine kinase [Chryseobacterium sp. Leaf180]
MSFVECHDEPIHIPGSIQSFGYLIGIDAASHEISFFSENITGLFNFSSPNDLFGKKISELPEIFRSISQSDIFRNLEYHTRRENETYFDKIQVGAKNYHFSVFRTGENVFLEFEEVISNPEKRITNKYDNFYIIEDGEEIWNQLLSTLFKIINYDRIMVYEFMSDGSGKVIAEKTNNNLESYLGLHYPESDIPRQARELYLKKRKRIFSNVHSDVVPILSRKPDLIDLTFAGSRAMSPIHAQYIKNSGASSSFSVSIIIDDQLWGLVTCQNVTPKHIDLEDRVQAGIFTVLASNAFSSFKSKKELEYRVNLSDKVASLKSDFLRYDTLQESLSENKEKIRKLIEADGVALVYDGEIIVEGNVPDREAITNISEWALNNFEDNVYISRSFLKDFGAELMLDESCAGIVIYIIDSSKKELLMWFRKEFDEHISWAGNPEKKIEKFSENGEERSMVSPRQSFEAFTEDIKGHSKRWSTRNEIAIQAIRDIILETSHKQYSTIKSLNDQLRKVNEELDSFSYTISHDLGTPLTIMKLNAQMLLNGMKNAEDNQKKKLKAIIDEIDSMADMMHDVLQLSKAKHVDIKLEKVETEQIIKKITDNAKMSFGSDKTEVEIHHLPEVLADKTMIHQVFLNIINNAVKYSAQKDAPKIEIRGEEKEDKIVYTISDNGIGIPEASRERMFKIFNRMDNAKKFKGNGVGLSIVHRIMKRIGGNVEYVSSENGTSFILTFQNPKVLSLV